MDEGESSERGNLASSSGQPSLPSVQDMVDTKMLNSVPALKIFTSLPVKRHCEMGVASSEAPPTSASRTASLEAHRETAVYSLHLVYEVQCNFFSSLLTVCCWVVCVHTCRR